jgi:hypothetical protein
VSRYRSHIALTVWPIVVLFALEVARTWPAIEGAPAFAAASPVSWGSLIACTIVVTVFLGAYARGWSVLGQEAPSGAGPYRSEGCRRLQKLAGGVAWALVVAHLILQWFMSVRVGPVALSHYELLRRFLSQPLVLAFYLFGLGALGLFASQGLAASFRAWGFGERRESSLGIELGCTLLSAVMVLMAINLVSHFATGRAHWMGSSSPGAEPANDADGIPQ